MGTRINIRIADSDYALLKEMSPKLSVSMSQFAGMAVHTGLKSLLMVLDPEKVLSPSFVASIQNEVEKTKEVGLIDSELPKG
jgi:hypothetical protein